jgi:hypothetical protein
MSLKIVVEAVFPPIPTRNYDFAAYFDGREESGIIGRGPTEDEAVRNLIFEQIERTEMEEHYCPACQELLEPHTQRDEHELLETEWICINAKCDRYGRV